VSRLLILLNLSSVGGSLIPRQLEVTMVVVRLSPPFLDIF